MKDLNTILRPTKLTDLIGQQHLLQLLENIIETNDNSSLILYGQSGTGKTSVAYILALALNKNFVLINATIASKKELLEAIVENEIIILDEIHRLNKDKQDLLLSYLESKAITVYATTTENPYFKINPAIRSRMHILQFQPLDNVDMIQGVKKILITKLQELKMNDLAIQDLVAFSAGDYRSVINNLSLLYKVFKGQEITSQQLKVVIPNITFYSDEKGDSHYNNLSAFHKSLRGSDVDAALYYGALIIKSGDLDGLFRRILCVAYEDIGLANPIMGLKVDAAIKAFERLGMPEGYLPLGNIICDLALSPKSNSSYVAMAKAREFVDNGKIYVVPKHLRDSHYASAAKLGHGLNYKYPHDFPNNYVKQKYLPKQIEDEIFFNFGASTNEVKIKNFWKIIKGK